MSHTEQIRKAMEEEKSNLSAAAAHLGKLLFLMKS